MNFDIISGNISRLVRSVLWPRLRKLYLRRYLRRPQMAANKSRNAIDKTWSHNLYFGYYIRCRLRWETSSSVAEHSKAVQSDSYRTFGELRSWRYVNSGWVSPLDQQSTSAFSRELRADVITSASELEEFNRTVISKRTRGTGVTLSRADFPGSVVLVAYVMWLPVKGDPLSVVDVKIDGRHVVVDLELNEEAQGREYPYLLLR
ncbi:MAG: hypothetical protein Ct9H300mP11_11860 [Chloroflexota bacterium]|nr:MAG: hypothetical protein Ct9H300mP11_11860 [Chloroflexota bacterium]